MIKCRECEELIKAVTAYREARERQEKVKDPGTTLTALDGYYLRIVDTAREVRQAEAEMYRALAVLEEAEGGYEAQG